MWGSRLESFILLLYFKFSTFSNDGPAEETMSNFRMYAKMLKEKLLPVWKDKTNKLTPSHLILEIVITACFYVM
jgi:hypothetical protein